MSARGRSRVRWWLLAVLATSMSTSGCGASPSAPVTAAKLAVAEAQGPAATPAPKAPMPAVAPRIPEAGPPLPPLSYESKGRRDPFVPIAPAMEKSGTIDVSASKLVGIIDGGQRLALVEAPGGLGYILKPGETLGNGRVTDIASGSVTFAVAGHAGQRETSVTLRLIKE